MTKIWILGAVVFGLFTTMSLTMTPPAVSAWDDAQREASTRPESCVLVLPMTEIVGRIPAEVLTFHEEYDVDGVHIVADGSAIIYASR